MTLIMQILPQAPLQQKKKIGKNSLGAQRLGKTHQPPPSVTYLAVYIAPFVITQCFGKCHTALLYRSEKQCILMFLNA